MPKLSTNNLKCGMKVLREVVDHQNQILLRSNETLTQEHITLLKMWGISEVARAAPLAASAILSATTAYSLLTF